jgi:hypothetical protein
MSVSALVEQLSAVYLSAPTRLYVLPDDVLRSVAAFVRRSDLIVLVRCSKRLVAVFGAQLGRRLDSLFVVAVLPTNLSIIRARNNRVLRMVFDSRCTCTHWSSKACSGR